jgi:phospholipid/cholesterol/gamma-HCH transport system permease protein
MGFGSLGVIVLSSSTVGISLVFLSVDQLKRLGGLSLLAFFFAKALLREICPVISGIVMAVRIGSQVTLEIGSVPVRKRSLTRGDGLETDLTKLFLPSFLAVLVVGPALYLLSSFVAVLAGVVSQTRWSGENFLQFYRMILDNFSIHDLEFGLYKTFLFGATVVIVAGYLGLITAPRTEDLQRATVTSIVFSSVVVLTINAIFAMSYTASSLIGELQKF